MIGRPAPPAPQDEQADESDHGDDAERVAAGTEHPRPEQVELDDDDLGDVAEPEVRTVGVAEVVDQDRHVAGRAVELVDEWWHPGDHSGEQRRAGPHREPAAIVAPELSRSTSAVTATSIPTTISR